MPRILGIFAVLLTVALATVAQILMKHQLGKLGGAPSSPGDLARYLFKVLLNPGVMIAFAMGFLGAVIYLVAISRLPITYLYPFASLSFPAVLLLGALVLGESITWYKVAGSFLIVSGVVIGALSD
jgi:drug/metabolite transporter (DMT)-like permease